MSKAALFTCAAATLALGIWTGLSRVGWDLPRAEAFSDLHGPLMILGVFGTLIGLERAVASGAHWPFVAPALSSAASLLLLIAPSRAPGAWAYVLAAAVTTLVALVAMLRQPAVFTLALEVGAVSLLTGSTLWATGQPVPDLVGWWLAFLVLTIAGERLELSRLLPGRSGSSPLFLLATGIFLAGAASGLMDATGSRLMGAGLLALAAWLARHDIAMRTIRGHGQPRFMAASMLAGYVWLGTAGLLLLIFPPGSTAYGYDMAVHAVLLGFVLSMVFGHALVILPAVGGVRVRYAPVLYGPLTVLHASVVFRLGADLFGSEAGRRWSSIATVIAILSFAASVAALTSGARRLLGRSES
ncbi:hypothetical protein [Methylobacterium durans]|uniref:NnrS family protein n=1 Tax=Methylobacterium durans TaxID=2202825 RepID=A0A2U8W0H9_9HYPH|nr:hypothetical protein [Methylobacterium durans]AWN39569.1 hypothetical protein DK389_02310 [Methylobacterium durans]